MASHPHFLRSGTLVIGANYWASHAGPQMWRQWDAGVVARDFARLASVGVKLLRVFPLWPDFQPIHFLRTAHGVPMEVRHGEAPLPSGAIGQAGVSAEMLQRFGLMADLAAKEGIDLIVGLVTGWMSGRLFVPPALEGLNPITDPVSIMWQVRLVRTMVREFRGHAAIRAWDLGNECNVMGEATRVQAWLWTSTLADAIRGTDSTRPVISGMHSLMADPSRPWAIRDQGELTDILTTHPYPLFTPHCNREPMDTIRPLLHATAETCLYADLSGKPAFVEEIGNFGPHFCAEDIGAKIWRGTLASVWAHDGRAALWWCAFDQMSLEGAPHDWVALERELGLLREDGAAKPLMAEIKAFQEMLRGLPITDLPPRRVDAICILTPGQDQWGAAYSAFILAKQAGFDLRFQYADRPLPQAQLYLLPSLVGLVSLPRLLEQELQERVLAGATAYVSVEDGFVRETFAMTGLEFVGRSGRDGACEFDLEDGLDTIPLTVASSTKFQVKDGNATVLARDKTGCPVFSVSSHGKGKVFFLSVPLETALAAKNEAFLPEGSPYWKIYQRLAQDRTVSRLVQKTSPLLGLTEHPRNERETVVLLINYSPAPLTEVVALANRFELAEVWHGAPPTAISPTQLKVELASNDYAVWHCRRRAQGANAIVGQGTY